jgi:hypothetical protein
MTRLPEARAALFGVTLALGAVALPPAADAQVVMDGRALFQQARAAYDGQRWEEALGLFRQSMTALPSPNTRLYVGRCLRALGRYGEAWQELSRAATEANARRAQEPRFTPTAEAALTESMALTDRIAYVVVEVPEAPAGTTVTLNGRVLSNEEFNTLLAVDGTTAAVEAVAPGVVPYRGTSQVTAGHQARFVVRFGAPNAAVATSESQPMVTLVQSGMNRPPLISTDGGASPWRSVGLSALGAGVALGIGGVVTAVLAQGNESALLEQCGGGGCGAAITPAQRALVDEGNTLVTATNALWISGGVLAAAGLVTFLVAGGRSDEVFTPTLAVGLGTVGLRGRF